MRSWRFHLESFPLPPRVLFNYVIEAWRILLGNSGYALSAAAAMGLVVAGAYFLSLQATLQLAYERYSQEVLLTLLALPVTALALGLLARMFLQLARHERFRLRLTIFGWRAYLWLLLWVFCYYVTYLTLFQAALDWEDLPALKGAIMQLRLALGFALFLWLLARMVFAPAYILEERLNLRAALKQSYLLTSGRTLKTLAFILMGMAALGLGWLPLATVLWLDPFSLDQVFLTATLYLGFVWSVVAGAVGGTLWALCFEIYRGERADLARRVEQDGKELVRSVERKIEKARAPSPRKKKPA